MNPTLSPPPTAPAAPAVPPTPATPAQLGVGARFSLHPMTSDFVEVILGALAAGDASRLEVTTDDVSTFVRGQEADVLTYLRDVIAAAASGGVHVVAQVLLSRGCPGEVACELPDDVVLHPVDLPALAPTGLCASAHWALYPLDDGGPDPHGRERTADHMAGIYAAIDRARERGTLTRGEHFVTRLDGDLADVLATVADGWLLVGREVRHVTTHATISLGSPSTPGTSGTGTSGASGASGTGTSGAADEDAR
ncbi:Ykof family thiamine-binding protein [Cellulomonas sp. NS3]|uniref:Ykof family thiamine-binding protein n=1 Tax=Cellulomonas sp. NS3 TaxID=2973977 RepID=UPI0021638156|nr:Ykof family thiamine-binding protein [Cellulomonas sp. NS3]